MPRRTPLFESHQKRGAHLVDFNGWEMPLTYTTIVEEHNAVRNGAGLFDVSHMGRLVFEGPERLRLLGHLLPTDVSARSPGDVVYSVVTTERGTVIDDVTGLFFADSIVLVVNASNIENVKTWVVKNQWGENAAVRDVTAKRGMIALQGPRSVEIISRHVGRGGVTPPLPAYFNFIETNFDGRPAVISRTGYTGEDGFEIIAPSSDIVSIWETLLSDGAVPIGLGARDTLRLEGGYPLYGHELSLEINPYEAGLGWVITSKTDYIGREALARVRAEGVKRRLIGFRVEGKQIARRGGELRKDGRAVGVVSSGSFAPTLSSGAGMAFVETALAVPGGRLTVVIRDKEVPVLLVKPSLVPKHVVARARG